MVFSPAEKELDMPEVSYQQALMANDAQKWLPNM
jgi:hypothetical protein